MICLAGPASPEARARQAIFLSEGLSFAASGELG